MLILELPKFVFHDVPLITWASSLWSKIFICIKLSLSRFDSHDDTVCEIQVWLMQRASTLQTSDRQQEELSWLQTSLRSWMARLSVSLAADAIRCLHGRQILLDTFKHKDVCWVVRRSVCATLSENPSFLGAVLFYLRLSSSNRQKRNLFASHSSFIRAKIVTGFFFF